MKTSVVMVFLSCVSFCSVANVSAKDSLAPFNNTLNDTVQINALIELSSRLQYSDSETAIRYSKAALAQSRVLSYRRGEFGAVHRLVCIYNTRGELGEAMQFVKNLVSSATETGDLHSVALAKAELGITYSLLHSELQAFKELTDALDIFRDLGDTQNFVKFAIRLGNIYAEHNNIGFARRYYTEALKASDGDASTQHLVNIHLGELLQKQQAFEQSLDYLDKSVEYFRAADDEKKLATALLLQGKARSESGQADRAFTSYREAELIFRKMKDNAKIARVLLEQGFLLQKLNDLDGSINHFRRALGHAVASGNLKDIAVIHSGLVSCYESKSDYVQATKYEKLSALYNDSLNTVTQKQKYDALKVLYDTELSERAIEELKAEKQNTLFLISLSIVLTVLVMIVFVLVIKQYKSMIRNTEDDKYRLKRILKKKIVEEKNLKSELDSKAKELTTFTLDMIRKKQIFENIRTGIEELRPKLEGVTPNQYKNLMEKLNSSIQQGRDWNNFNKYFDQVHPEFFSNLCAAYPDLNEYDQRLCALIRLNLNSKQISLVMDIAAESAKVAKYRLRKKLGISASEDFETFFRRFSSEVNGKSDEHLINGYMSLENN